MVTRTSKTTRTRPLDLVLAGGGVKGIGLVGAVVRLMEAGYRPNRIAGTSAGSIVGSIAAAAAKSKTAVPQDIRDLVLSLDYSKFLDPGPIERVPLLGPAWAILQGSTTTRSPRNAGTGWSSPPPTSPAGSWSACRGTTAVSTAWTPTSSRSPMRCARRCRFPSCSARFG
jgi:hypothetical protein